MYKPRDSTTTHIYWHYLNPSNVSLEEAFFRIYPQENANYDNWKVIRLTTQLSPEKFPAQGFQQATNSRFIGLSKIVLKTLEANYLKKHQYKNTMNPITKEEFYWELNKFISNNPNQSLSLLKELEI
jgi:hypothetical protein